MTKKERQRQALGVLKKAIEKVEEIIADTKEKIRVLEAEHWE